jgi:hypothetical protein
MSHDLRAKKRVLLAVSDTQKTRDEGKIPAVAGSRQGANAPDQLAALQRSTGARHAPKRIFLRGGVVDRNLLTLANAAQRDYGSALQSGVGFAGMIDVPPGAIGRGNNPAARTKAHPTIAEVKIIVIGKPDHRAVNGKNGLGAAQGNRSKEAAAASSVRVPSRTDAHFLPTQSRMPIVHSHRPRPQGRAYSKTNRDERQQALVLSTRRRVKGPLLVRAGAEKVLVARLFFFQERPEAAGPYAPTKGEARA